jgi:hypothetical protein
VDANAYHCNHGGARRGTRMSLTPPEVGSLTSSMVRWEFAEYVFAALVTLACVGEGIAEFSKWFRGDDNKEKRERLSKWSTIVLSCALALELVCLIKTNELSGKVIGSLDEKARDASEKALAALSDSTSATTKSEHAVSDANSAKQASEKAALESETAQKVASSAIDLATGAREEADSFEHDIVAAKQQATNAESHLADAMKEATHAELEVETAQGIVAGTEGAPCSRIEIKSGTKVLLRCCWRLRILRPSCDSPGCICAIRLDQDSI